MRFSRKSFLVTLAVLGVIGSISFAVSANAQIMQGLTTAANTAGLPGKPTGGFEQALGSIIGSLMGLIGSIMFLYMLYGGFRWMIAGGDNKAVSQAQSIIQNAVIGLTIIIFAYALSSFVFSKLTSVASAPSASSATTAPATGSGQSCQSGYSCMTPNVDTMECPGVAGANGCSASQACCKLIN